MKKYAVVIHEDPEGGYWAEVPALPGCYSQGETMDEVLENVREAIAGVLEVMKEQGRIRSRTFRFWNSQFEADYRLRDLSHCRGEWMAVTAHQG